MKITYVLLKLSSNHSNCLELGPTKDILRGRSILSLTLFRVGRA